MSLSNGHPVQSPRSPVFHTARDVYQRLEELESSISNATFRANLFVTSAVSFVGDHALDRKAPLQHTVEAIDAEIQAIGQVLKDDALFQAVPRKNRGDILQVVQKALHDLKARAQDLKGRVALLPKALQLRQDADKLIRKAKKEIHTERDETCIERRYKLRRDLCNCLMRNPQMPLDLSRGIFAHLHKLQRRLPGETPESQAFEGFYEVLSQQRKGTLDRAAIRTAIEQMTIKPATLGGITLEEAIYQRTNQVYGKPVADSCGKVKVVEKLNWLLEIVDTLHKELCETREVESDTDSSDDEKEVDEEDRLSGVSTDSDDYFELRTSLEPVTTPTLRGASPNAHPNGDGTVTGSPWKVMVTGPDMLPLSLGDGAASSSAKGVPSRSMVAPIKYHLRLPINDPGEQLYLLAKECRAMSGISGIQQSLVMGSLETDFERLPESVKADIRTTLGKTDNLFLDVKGFVRAIEAHPLTIAYKQKKRADDADNLSASSDEASTGRPSHVRTFSAEEALKARELSKEKSQLQRKLSQLSRMLTSLEEFAKDGALMKDSAQLNQKMTELFNKRFPTREEKISMYRALGRHFGKKQDDASAEGYGRQNLAQHLIPIQRKITQWQEKVRLQIDAYKK